MFKPIQCSKKHMINADMQQQTNITKSDLVTQNSKILHINYLGSQCDYQEIWQKMRAFTMQRNATTYDELWLLEHQHVFTQGKAGKPEHVIFLGDVPLVQTDRGGQVTYHGPGQLIGYFLCDLRRKNLGVKKFVHLLEQAIVDTLAEYKIEAKNRVDAPGVYITTTGAKICSLGLHIQRGCSYHGLALNVNSDLSYFNRINPCGYKGLCMANICDFVPNITLHEVSQKLYFHIQKLFNYTEVINNEHK